MGRKKNLAQRVHIIKVAFQLFLQDGYDKVTTKQIAEACGIAHSLLHYYYPTKSDLLTDIVNTMIAKLQSYLTQQEIDLTDKLFVYGLFNRLLFETLVINRKLFGIYQAALTDGEVMRRWTKYAVEKLGLHSSGEPSEKAKISPYMLSGSMGQILLLYIDFEIELEFRETVNLALESFYTANGLTRAWIHATIGLIDRRMTPNFIRGFLNDFAAMMQS